MDEQRLIDLETKISYQEILIEELQNEVYDQYLRLNQQIKELNEKLNSLNKSDDPKNEKPPHY